MLYFHPDLKPSEAIKLRAKELRKDSTPAEQLLWHKLRARRFKNTWFRWQVPMGHYILDFYTASVKLAIELDGPLHLYQQKKDQKRTEWLNRYGISVIRFPNESVLLHIDHTLQTIATQLDYLAEHGPLEADFSLF